MNLRYKLKIGLCALLALLPPALLLAGRGADAAYIDGGSGYAALIFDEAANEAEIHAALVQQGIKNIISASTETAFLNDFSGVEAVPLNEYFFRIEDYDPRNDGYAAAARKLFISDGKRRLYLPVNELSGFGMENAKERLTRSLGTTPFELAQRQYTRSPLPALAFFGLALLLFALAIRFSIKLSGDRFLLAYALAFAPSLAVAGRTGGGLAACAVLLALFQILRSPLQRFFTGLAIAPESALTSKRLAMRFAAEFEGEAITTGILLALYAALAVAARIEPAAALGTLGCFTLAFLVFSYIEATFSRAARHIRFIFIPIRSGAYGVKKFPTLPLPFLCVAGISLLAPVFTRGGTLESKPLDFVPRGGFTLTEADYQTHAAFQKQFAYRKLNAGGGEDAAFLHYSIGEDGLIESALPVVETLDFPDSASFNETAVNWRLGPLVMFLNGSREFAVPALSPPGSRAGIAGSLAAFVLALALYLPFAARRHRKKTSLLIYH